MKQLLTILTVIVCTSCGSDIQQQQNIITVYDTIRVNAPVKVKDTGSATSENRPHESIVAQIFKEDYGKTYFNIRSEIQTTPSLPDGQYWEIITYSLNKTGSSDADCLNNHNVNGIFYINGKRYNYWDREIEIVPQGAKVSTNCSNMVIYLEPKTQIY